MEGMGMGGRTWEWKGECGEGWDRLPTDGLKSILPLWKIISLSLELITN